MKCTKIVLMITALLALPAGGWTKTVLQHRTIHEDRHNHVFLMCRLDESHHVVPQNFEHPVRLSPEQVARLMGQLKYSKSVLFKWRGEHDVFFESEIQKLAKDISRALREVSPDEWVAFASTIQSRDAIDPVPLFTDGYIFRKGGDLHVVLLNLKTDISRHKRPRTGDPRECFSLEFKRLNLTEGISVPPVRPGTRFLDKPHDNWAVMDVVSLLGQGKVSPVEPGEKIEKKNLLERMQVLKDLYVRDLITEEEYRKKKEELLDQL